jgi:hypothetical protein
MKKIIFNDESWTIHIGNYAEGSPSIILTKKNKGARTALDIWEDLVVSVLIDELDIDEIAIKDFAENKGILKVLIDEEIIFEPHRFHIEKYTYHVVELPIVRLKKDNPNLAGTKPKVSIQKSQHKTNLAKPAAK